MSAFEIGKTYTDGRGQEHMIVGPTRYGDERDKELVWTTSGVHFRQADGRYSPYGVPLAMPSINDLCMKDHSGAAHGTAAVQAADTRGDPPLTAPPSTPTPKGP